MSMSEIMWAYTSISPEAALEALDARNPNEGAAYINTYCLQGPKAAHDYLWNRIWYLFTREQSQKSFNNH